MAWVCNICSGTLALMYIMYMVILVWKKHFQQFVLLLAQQCRPRIGNYCSVFELVPVVFMLVKAVALGMCYYNELSL